MSPKSVARLISHEASLLTTKETTLERAPFLTGWFELSWSGHARLTLHKIAGTTADKKK